MLKLTQRMSIKGFESFHIQNLRVFSLFLISESYKLHTLNNEIKIEYFEDLLRLTI